MTGWLEISARGTSPRRWQRHSRKGLTASRTFLFRVILPLAAIVGLYETRTLESTQGGETVRGRRMLVVQDLSGSMDVHNQTVERRLESLRESGMVSEIACRLSNNEFPDFVACVDRLTRAGAADGLYVFADFMWQWTPEGLSQVAREIRGSGMRLYLETVGDEPARELAAIAAESGGALIHTNDAGGQR